MGLAEQKSPLGNSLPEAGKWRYPALVFVIILLQFFPLSTLEDGQCAYLHVHTGSQYRPLRRFHTTYKKITRQSKLPSLLDQSTSRNATDLRHRCLPATHQPP